MISTLLYLAAFVIVASDSDTTLRVYAGADSTWQLSELNGSPFDADATLHFPAAGVLAGDGPCNSYRTGLRAPYPWFDSGPVISTKRACPDLAAETAFFKALEDATLSEASEDTLVLSTEDRVLMVFRPAD